MNLFKKYNEEITESFSKSVYELSKTREISVAEIGRTIGYETPQSFNEVVKRRSKIKEERLIKYCKIYGFKKSDFLPYEEYTPPLLNEERVEYNESKKNPIIERIDKKFKTIEKTNEAFIKLFEAGIELTKSHHEDIKELRYLVGV